jgi:uncharacterized protein (DUF1697 family)
MRHKETALMTKFVALLRAVNVDVFVLETKPPPDATTNLRGRVDEELRAGGREIYVHYPSGMGQSKLLVPAAKNATTRNMNTIAKLVAMSS